MKINVKPLTPETVAYIKKTVWTIKEGQDQFCQAYDMCLVDVAGKNWRQTWPKWDDLDGVIEAVEKQMKSICIESGMVLTVFNRYRTAARKWALHDVPFVMGANFAVGEIKRAQELAKTYTDGTAEKRINRAYREIRAERNIKSAKQQVSHKGTLLEFPEEGADPDDFLKKSFETLRTWLNHPAVQIIIQRRKSFEEQFLAEVTAKKKGKKVPCKL